MVHVSGLLVPLVIYVFVHVLLVCALPYVCTDTVFTVLQVM